MRKILALLIPLLIASCGNARRDARFEGFSPSDYRSYKMDAATDFENGGYGITIYLGSVRRKGMKSWTPFLHTHRNTDPFSYSGYAAGFTFLSNKTLEVDEVIVNFNDGPPVAYKRLKVKPGSEEFKIEAMQDYWVPPSFPIAAAKAPELPRGRYRVRVRYHADGKECDAHWDLFYRPRLNDAPPLAPTCSTLADHHSRVA